MNGIKNGAFPNPVTSRKYPNQCPDSKLKKGNSSPTPLKALDMPEIPDLPALPTLPALPPLPSLAKKNARDFSV